MLLRNGTTQIFDAPDAGGIAGVIDVLTRRELVFVYSGAKFTLRSGIITGFADALAQELTNHMLDTGASHDAAAIDFDNSSVPVEFAATAVATTVQAALDGLTTDVGGLASTNNWTAVNDFDAGVDFNAGFDMKTGLARFQSTGPVTFSGTGQVQFGAGLADNDVFIQTWDNSGNTSQELQMGTHVRSSGLHLEDAGALVASLPNSQITTAADQTWIVEANMVGCEIGDSTVTLVRKHVVKVEVNSGGTCALTQLTSDISDETAADLILEIAIASGTDIAMKASKASAQDYAVAGYMVATLCKPLL